MKLDIKVPPCYPHSTDLEWSCTIGTIMDISAHYALGENSIIPYSLFNLCELVTVVSSHHHFSSFFYENNEFLMFFSVHSSLSENVGKLI